MKRYKEKAIYKIENKINHKIYIGQSINPEERFEQHINRHYRYRSLINQAIKKYGVQNFSFEVLGWFEDYNEKEKEYISYYNCLVPNGYNVLSGGEEPPHNHNGAKITEQQAVLIQKDLLDWRIQRRTIVKKYNITQDMIRHIIDGSAWYNDNLTYPLRPTEKEINNWRAEQVIDMLKNTTLSQKEIGQNVGWNKSAVTMINIGKNYHKDDLDYPIRK